MKTSHNTLSMHAVTTLPAGEEMDDAQEPPRLDLFGDAWSLDLAGNHHTERSGAARRPAEAEMGAMRARARRFVDTLTHGHALQAAQLAVAIKTTPQLAEQLLSELEGELLTRWKPGRFARLVVKRPPGVGGFLAGLTSGDESARFSDTQLSANEELTSGSADEAAGSSARSAALRRTALTPLAAGRGLARASPGGAPPPSARRKTLAVTPKVPPATPKAPPTTPFGRGIGSSGKKGRGIRTPSSDGPRILEPKWIGRPPRTRKLSQTVRPVQSGRGVVR